MIKASEQTSMGTFGCEQSLAEKLERTENSPMRASLLFLEEDSQLDYSPVARTASIQETLGQYMTPVKVADFIANLFPQPNGEVYLLDAGAGKGALTDAFLSRWGKETFAPINADAHELDDAMLSELRGRMAQSARDKGAEFRVFDGDFIVNATTMIRLGSGRRYSHAILNPPYKKISTSSVHRSCLRAIGLETVNLYTGFLGAALELLDDGGQLAAIVPRSFCNGPYYEPFRKFLFERAALRHIHLFEARNKAFKADAVLQENIIVLVERDGSVRDITISMSTDDTFSDYSELVVSHDRVVLPNDHAQVIHIPTSDDISILDSSEAFRSSLADIGLSVSTGPVVDFRMKEWLRAMPEPGAVPLLYPVHFSGNQFSWPKAESKKANALVRNASTEKWLYPNGFYTVVRRFSSKEERRRVVASVVDPSHFEHDALGFENHLNVIHSGRAPIPEEIARGIAVFLNSTPVDSYFRRFNGHTQVNATDLKMLKYPTRDVLARWGHLAKGSEGLSQDDIDAMVVASA
ncbi:MAG: Eco57I restriction-modification methylase domain-containing protein [Gemmatimonas sp.]